MPVSRNIHVNISGQVTPTTGQVRIMEQIDWADVPARLGEIFGPTTSSGIVATELDPLFGLWRAQSVDFEPLCDKMTDTVAGGAGGDVTMPVFQKAKLSITYSSIEQESPTSQDEADQDGEGDPVPFLSHSWSIGGDFITMDDSSMYWSSGTSAKATGIAANKIIPTIEHSINWKRVLNPPFKAIRDCLGKINSKTMSFSTGKIYPECLLFNGAELSRDIMSDGTRAWDMTYRFSERRVDATRVKSGHTYTLSGTSYAAYSYDGTGPIGNISTAEQDAIAAAGDSMGGIYGGWNHFFDKDTGRHKRLHNTRPASLEYQYQEDEAIYKKYDLLKLFEQES